MKYRDFTCMSQYLCSRVQKTRLPKDYQSLVELRTGSRWLCRSTCECTLAPLICSASPSLLARRASNLEISYKSCCHHEDKAFNCKYSRASTWHLWSLSSPLSERQPYFPSPSASGPYYLRPRQTQPPSWSAASTLNISHSFLGYIR